MTIRLLSNRVTHFDHLVREEKTALWALRYLLGPHNWKSSIALKKIFGWDAERLQEKFQAIFLQTVCAAASLEYSATEAHLLRVLADMQNNYESRPLRSELGHALMYLGLTLAAYGYWLPVRKEEEIENLSSLTKMQDNNPILMQAAE